jgi:RNA polymerase sigma-70 factor, ECF subfamily
MPIGVQQDASGDRARPELEAMLRRAANGEQTAWREIVQAYSMRVFGLLRAQCGDGDLAEELTQSTFCTIVQKLPSYSELGKFEAWLFRIAMNRLRDEMRRRRRQAAPVENESLAGMADAGKDGGAHAMDEGDRASLRNALAQLSDADQRIIHLRHHAELSFKQIADVLGEPLGTVLARHHRSLKKLRDILSRAGGPGAPPDGSEGDDT